MWHVTCDMWRMTCDRWHVKGDLYGNCAFPVTFLTPHMPILPKVVTCDMWHVTCDMWHVTCDMWQVTSMAIVPFQWHFWYPTCLYYQKLWHVTCDMWHVTCDMWHVTSDRWHVTGDFYGNCAFPVSFSTPHKGNIGSSQYGYGDRVTTNMSHVTRDMWQVTKTTCNVVPTYI